MKTLLLTLVLSVSVLAQAKINRFIINGNELKPYQVPQMAQLTGDGWTCTATLIGPRVIITAAHCVEGANYNGLEQSFGPTSDNKYYKARMIRHPEYDIYSEAVNIPYDFAVRNDLAIGILDRDVEGITPITITPRTPAMQEAVLYAGRGLPNFKRMWGQGRVVTVSDIGVTIRGFGQNMQVADGGDSGGPNFIVNSQTRELQVFAITSTSTRKNDYTLQTGWEEALPYTQGISRIFPKKTQSARPRQMVFIENMVDKHQLKICGMTMQCPPVTMD